LQIGTSMTMPLGGLPNQIHASQLGVLLRRWRQRQCIVYVFGTWPASEGCHSLCMRGTATVWQKDQASVKIQTPACVQLPDLWPASQPRKQPTNMPTCQNKQPLTGCKIIHSKIIQMQHCQAHNMHTVEGRMCCGIPSLPGSIGVFKSQTCAVVVGNPRAH
jgi:hypothetical protein